MDENKYESSEESLGDQIEIVNDSFDTDLDIQLLDNIYLHQLPYILFPLFELVHYFITTAKIRSDFGAEFSRKSPLSSLIFVIVSCNAGSVLCNFLLGLPLASAFKNEVNLLMILLVWIGIYFSPQDMIYKIIRSKSVLVIMCSIKEIDRMRKIVSGVTMSYDIFPGLILVSAMAGVFKGAGTSIIRPLIISVCKPCSDSGHGHSLTNEITSPNTTTKLCWMASLCWVGILNLPGLRSSSWLCSTVYNCAVLLFLIYRMEIVLNISKLILSQEAANNNQDDGMKKEAENISKENQLKKDE